MNKYQRIGIRVAISTNVGLLVAVIACLAAWRDIGGRINFWPEGLATRRALDELNSLIEAYQRDAKTLPPSLADLRRVQGVYATFKFDENGSPLDGWGRPFTYSVDGTNYVIMSYGRDGKPGGVGTNHDLSNLARSSREADPTFAQFLFNPLARGVLFTCLACGVAAFWLSMRTVNPAGLHGWAIASLIVKLVFTILGALAASFFMSVIHIPNHH